LLPPIALCKRAATTPPPQAKKTTTEETTPVIDTGTASGSSSREDAKEVDGERSELDTTTSSPRKIDASKLKGLTWFQKMKTKKQAGEEELGSLLSASGSRD
jgi:hypothetical protein